MRIKMAPWRSLVASFWLLLTIFHSTSADCPRRSVLAASSGTITMLTQDYTSNTFCQWLIVGQAGKVVNIHFDKFLTECNYDFLYIRDGDSLESPLLGSFSGGEIPDPLVAVSGSVLVHFYSDLNFQPSSGGFRLVYNVTDCQLGCESCVGGVCQCNANFSGPTCSLLNCSSPADPCNCPLGYAGQGCRLSVEGTQGEGQWVQLAPSGSGLESRAGHSAVWDEDTKSLWVYGGFSLSDVSDGILRYSMDNNTWQSLMTRPSWLLGTYKHQAQSVRGCMFVLGGSTAAGLTDQFWRFCYQNMSYTQLTGYPESVTDHTLSVVDDRWLYSVGGLSTEGRFLSHIYRYDTLSPGSSWEFVSVKGGKELNCRLAGHSTVYYQDSRSLIVFGGHSPSTARFSKLSTSMYAFHVDTQMWSRINYSTSTATPQPMAFHTANILGNYMLVFGGQLMGAPGSWVCVNSNLFAYHLTCHKWVDLTKLYNSQSIINSAAGPEGKGKYSHASAVVNGNLLLVVGGYRGNVLGDLWAYKAPSSIAVSKQSPSSGSTRCTNYNLAEGCIADGECFWCAAPPISGCASRNRTRDCVNSKPLYDCPGVCSVLTDCQSCISQGHGSASTITPFLNQLETCIWCIHDRVCRSNASVNGVCPQPLTFGSGWWNSNSTSALSLSQCVSTFNRPAGVRYGVYTVPVDLSSPDEVLFASETYFSWSRPSGASVAVARFFLRPSVVTQQINVQLRASIAANVSMTFNGSEIFSAQMDIAQILAMTLLPVKRGNRYLTQVFASRQGSMILASPFALLQWDAIGSVARIGMEFLEPYGGGNCSVLGTCLACQLDSFCGWCPLTGQCVIRSSTRSASQCGTLAADFWLITDPGQCDNCSDFTDCQQCADSGFCEWSAQLLTCTRRGVSNASVADSMLCPSPCHNRTNCSSCLAPGDECIWCRNSATCESFSPYLATHSFGQCTGWLENADKQSQVNSSLVGSKCTSCSSWTTCGSCLGALGCGWCGVDFNPLVGLCVTGDHNSPFNCSDTVSALNVSSLLLNFNYSWDPFTSSSLQELSSNASFSYDLCPDINECLLFNNLCHPNATCVNIPSSYICQCNQGFEGDGKLFCNKTCPQACIHGTCSGAPRYQCDCHLGWTNVTCDTDCGCHNHSTCSNGTGVCDACQEYTYGDSCQFCLPGSYGDGTIYPGCLPCQCNGHGLSDLGLCNVTTGECFCEEGYTGTACEVCAQGLVGDPRNGSLCYLYSFERLVVYNATGTKGVTSEARYSRDSFIQWVVTPHSNLHTVPDSGTPRIIVTVDSINTSCPLGYLYVFDGLPPSNGSSGSKASYCGQVPHTRSVIINSGYATLQFYGNSSLGELFTAHFTVLKCPDSCPGNRGCSGNQCTCLPGYGGVDCLQELCPRNCSGNGLCDEETSLCLCSSGYTGAACDVLSPYTLVTFFDSSLAHQLPAPSSIYFQTVVGCGELGMYLFGGLCIERGPLSEVWVYKELRWRKLAVTGTSPSPRYLHAAECVGDTMYVHGGIVKDSRGFLSTSAELWSFSLTNQNWTLLNGSTQRIAGHRMTAVSQDLLIVTGGFDSLSDWINNTYSFRLSDSRWSVNSQATGAVPAGLMLHTAVYHSPSGSLYVHGGYRYYIDRMFPSDATYMYLVSQHRWYRRPDTADQPAARFLHSAVQDGSRMIVIGGLSSLSTVYNSVFIYEYDCDAWHNMTEIYAELSAPFAGHSSVANGSTVYTFHSMPGASMVSVISLPQDLCTLYSTDVSDCLSHRGCNFCNSSDGHNFCYRTQLPTQCSNATVTSNPSLCDSSVVTERVCTQYKDCSQCVTAWPYFGQIAQKCKWCSFCVVGKCIDAEKDCQKENSCNRNQSEKLIAEDCVELRCRSATCEQCVTERQDAKGCIWTRNFMRSSEVGRQVNMEPFENWNCVTGLLLELSSIQVWTAPPSTCPVPCQALSSCDACLASDGSSGGPAKCYWSVRLGQCLPPAALPILCNEGACAPLIASGQPNLCPLGCSQYTKCSDCLSNPSCGWCSSQNASQTDTGTCMLGNQNGAGAKSDCPAGFNASQSQDEGVVSSWHFFTCPPENECNNSHSTCDLNKEDCFDLEIGFYCECKEGYERSGAICVPVCSQGCVKGTCVLPNECECFFSWVGDNCSTPCNCNNHSSCISPELRDNCTQCVHNTIGSQCGLCDKMFVGNAVNGGVCDSCFSVCNNHADVCMTKNNYKLSLLNNTWLDTYPDWISQGPISKENITCINCGNNTTGERCELCLDGFFRPTGDDISKPCIPCQCQGHSFTCDKTTGSGCNCQNNTESPCISSPYTGGRPCYEFQCSTCKDGFTGTPTDYHQCYRKMEVEKDYCLTDHPNDYNACTNSPPLPAGRTIFVAVLPKYRNVDIRIYLDVIQGEVDIYLSKSENLFKVSWNATLQEHTITLDEDFEVISLTSNNTRRKRDTSTRMLRRDASNSSTLLLWQETSLSSAPAKYISIESAYTVHYMRGAKSRVIVTLPQDVYSLKSDKFYLIVVGRDPGGSLGSITFRQDQISIHLFIFFSVFFSCFFKFLCICVIVWKFKTMYNQNQQRLQREVELGQMASRPFASVLLCFDDSPDEVPPPAKKRHELQVNPVACEYTDDGIAVVGTVMFELPGGESTPVRATFGSALMTMRVMYPHRQTKTEKPKQALA